MRRADLNLVAAFVLITAGGVCAAQDSLNTHTEHRAAHAKHTDPIHACGTQPPDAGVRGTYFPSQWPGGVVPYQFGGNVTAQNQIAARNAMDEIEAVCGVVFVPRSGEPNYLHYNTHATTSFVTSLGFKSGQTTVHISTSAWGSHWTIVHELTHTLGLWHEMGHADRFAHVSLNTLNICGTPLTSFQPWPGQAVIGPYDYASVQHYDQFTNSCGSRTMSVRAPYQRKWQWRLGAANANQLSTGDRWALTTLYGGNPPPSYFAMTGPTRGQVVGQSWSPTFSWDASQLADSYRVLVDDDPAFGSPEIDTVVVTNSYAHGAPLADDTVYYWKVSATNAQGTTDAYPLDRFAFYTGSSLPATLHVDDSAAAGGLGGSWGDALDSLQTACVLAYEIDGGVTEIRVAGGVYTPDQGTGDRALSFDLESGVALRGGYAGVGAADPDLRDTSLHETVLSGDLLGDDTPGVFTSNRTDNSYHVMRLIGLENVVIDGVTFSGGQADGPNFQDQFGGGLSLDDTDATVTDCTFRDNAASSAATGGGGLAIVYESNAAVSNCVFDTNFDAAWGGGAVNVEFSASATITDCVFTNNVTGPGGWGGAAFHQGAIAAYERCRFESNSGFNGGAIGAWTNGNPTFINCVFDSNSASGAGGGAGGAILGNTTCTIAAHGCEFVDNTAGFAGAAVRVSATSTAELVNCTIVGNPPGPSGPALTPDGTSSVTVANSVLWSNGFSSITAPATVSYSNIQNGFAGTGNIDTDPLFADLADRDLRPAAGSPIIDAGDTGAVPGALAEDLDGSPRIIDDPATTDTGVGGPPVVDMGAYEFQPPACLPDLTTTGAGAGDPGFGVPDGQVTSADIQYYVNLFVALDPGADLTTTGAGAGDPGFGVPDGQVTSADIQFYVNAFVAGCP